MTNPPNISNLTDAKFAEVKLAKTLYKFITHEQEAIEQERERLKQMREDYERIQQHIEKSDTLCTEAVKVFGEYVKQSDSELESAGDIGYEGGNQETGEMAEGSGEAGDGGGDTSSSTHLGDVD